ncbi:MAG: isoleucine--tRNA ligase [Magnetococcales bacterium]|nr:isoleucine--tRNA ligase [Magnetococcales bacterium]
MDYKTTVHLPQTPFPMRAGLPQKEPEVLARWDRLDLYRLQRQAARGREPFILHDGPPYANGDLHMGHAINKVLKDVIVRSRQMMGMDANYVPGWDCHGLPIETKVEQEFKKKGLDKGRMDPVTFRQECRRFAAGWVDRQREQFQRLGVGGDWRNPYLTMDFRFEADTVRELGRFLANGGLFKGLKPVYWCPHDVTALAEAEVEYQDHVSTAIYVKFPVAQDEDLAGIDPALAGDQVSVVIWTTTPWTIPANLAVALNPEFTYVALRIHDPRGNPGLGAGEVLILAEGLWEPVTAALGLGVTDAEIQGRFPGRSLERKRFRHPYLEQDAPIVLGSHVTLEAGTGCVHIAPGHGQDDHVVGSRYGLAAFNPVDDHGRFVAGTPHVAGLHVDQANPAVVELLRERGKLLAAAPLEHSYPHCWRCHRPVITRATPQWFIAMETNGLRDRALAAIRATRWIPDWGEGRIYNMVARRPDWCVSRQRNWGVPITVITCAACGENVTGPGVVETIAQAVEQAGADVWFQKTAAEFLPPGFRCPRCGAGEFAKESDILDVWFDSGVTHAAVLERRDDLRWPADLYLEGSDQHRGWFHSSLLTSVGTRGVAPYRAVLTHGFVVDGKGRKMSKSLGNVIAPDKVIKQYGADILRLWVTAEDYAADIRISDEILKGLSDAYRRIRNTIRFLLGNLAGFDPGAGRVPWAELPGLDRWALHRLAQLIDQVETAYRQYDFHRVYQDLHYFCAMDLGAFYLDILKDRLYCEGATAPARRAAQTVLHEILEALVRLMAPILVFTAEEVWQHMDRREAPSVHLADLPRPRPEWLDEELEQRWERFRAIRAGVYRQLEQDRNAKRIGSFMEATVILWADPPTLAFLAGFDDLFRLLIVAEVTVAPLASSPPTAVQLEEEAGLRVQTGQASGAKCERCWNRDPRVGQFADHPQLCPRCRDVVGSAA